MGMGYFDFPSPPCGQHVIAPYIVDFYCYEIGLVIELNGNDAEQVMHAVAEVTIAMRSDISSDNDPEALRSAAETIMANSRKIERLDDIEHSKSKPDANAANNKQKKGDSKDDART